MWSPKERDIKLQALIDQITNRQCYAHLWNYDFILNQTRELSGSNSNSTKWWLEYGAWDRIPHLQAALPKYDWVLYGDLDYIIKDYSRPLDSFIKEFEMYGVNNVQVLIPVDDNEADIPRSFSSFAIMIKNGPFGKRLLENWRTFAAGMCPNGNFESKTKSYEWYHCDQPGLWYALMQTHKDFYPNDAHHRPNIAQCNEDTGYIQDDYWLGFREYFTKVGYKVGNYGEHLSRVPKDQAIIWSKSSNQSMSGLGVNRNWSFEDKYREHAFAFHWNKPSSQWDPDMQLTLAVCKEIHGCFARMNNETLKIESGCMPTDIANTTNRLHKASEAELEKTLNDLRGIMDREDIVQETNTSKISMLDKSVFQSGDRVRARYKGKGKRWYKGTIVGVLDDSTYDIDYDDGDSDRALPVKFIRRMRKK